VKSLQTTDNTTDDGRQVMAIVHMDWSRWTKNSNYSFKFYFMFGCIYPDHRRMGHGFRFLLPLFSTTPPFFKIFI
jgi:hypothetical protein